MRALLQRVTFARVEVETKVVGRIEKGILAFIGVEKNDVIQDAIYIAEKITGLRIFEDEAGKLNLNIFDSGGSVLAISQFTLLGDARKGKRPSFSNAQEPQSANELFEKTCEILKQNNVEVQKGVFGADMKVSLCNDGPVTILLDSRKTF